MERIEGENERQGGDDGGFESGEGGEKRMRGRGWAWRKG